MDENGLLLLKITVIDHQIVMLKYGLKLIKMFKMNLSSITFTISGLLAKSNEDRTEKVTCCSSEYLSFSNKIWHKL
jgi:hypothetical protein